MSIKDSYRVSADEWSNCKLWGSHMAGREIASNFKAIIKTKVEDPSRSLLKRLCPVHFSAQPPCGGVNIKVKELIAFLHILQNHSDVDCMDV